MNIRNGSASPTTMKSDGKSINHHRRMKPTINDRHISTSSTSAIQHAKRQRQFTYLLPALICRLLSNNINIQDGRQSITMQHETIDNYRKNSIPQQQGLQIYRHKKVKGDRMLDVPLIPKQLRNCRCSSSTMPQHRNFWRLSKMAATSDN